MTPSHNLAQALLPEFDQEMTTTRALLERVPDSQGAWKPHPKSFSLGHLAQLVSWMPGWMTRTLRETNMTLSGPPPYSLEPTSTLLREFDTNVREARAAIAASSDEDFQTIWSFGSGDTVFFSMPRRAAVRQHLNHLIHHRGQLSVYLRLVDVPLPSIYGPTADEPWGGPANK